MLHKLLSFIAGFVVCAVVLVTISFFTDHQLLRIESIEWESLSGGSEALDQDVASFWQTQRNAWKKRWIWELRLNDLARKIEEDQRVDRVIIRRKLPNKLHISVQTHKPFLLLMGTSGRPLSISQNASVLPLSESQSVPNLPILRGMNFHKNKKDRKKAIQLYQSIVKHNSVFAQKISEIHYNDKEGFTVNLVGSGVKVKLGLSQWMVRSLLTERVLKYLDAHQLQARVIDARFNKKVVVRLRDAP